MLGSLARRGHGSGRGREVERETDGRWPLRDHRGRPVVAVTGVGVVTSLGVGLADNWEAVTAGRSGVSRITRFPIAHLSTTIAGTIDYLPVDSARLTLAAGELAGDEAIAMAGIGQPGNFPARCSSPSRRSSSSGRCAGASSTPPTPDVADAYDRMIAAAASANDRGDFERLMYGHVGEMLAERFGTKGAPISLTTACASGATAIQLGVEAIRRGETKAALCVGTDCSVTAEQVIRFSLLSALSNHNEDPEEAAKPFSKNRDGFVIAEGSAALVIEDYDAARGRAAPRSSPSSAVPPRSRTTSTARAPSPTAPRSSPRSATPSTMPASTPGEIDYINAHGTGTPENDKMEAISLEQLFGERIRGVPISSNKSMIGHTLTSSGTIEAVFSVQTIAPASFRRRSTTRCPIRPSISTSCPNVARSSRSRRCSPTPSASAARTPA